MVRVITFNAAHSFMLAKQINEWMKEHPSCVIKQISYAAKEELWSALVLYEVTK